MSRYDRSLTVFSPDGRLFQVEYALQAVKKGSAVVGVRGKDCVVMAVEKSKVDPLNDDRFAPAKKIAAVDGNITIACTGYVPSFAQSSRHLAATFVGSLPFSSSSQMRFSAARSVPLQSSPFVPKDGVGCAWSSPFLPNLVLTTLSANETKSLMADARILVDKVRLEAQSFRLTVEDAPSTEYLARHLATVQQRYTVRGGRRPFGVSCLIGGVDGWSLHMHSPSSLPQERRKEENCDSERRARERILK